MKKNEILFLVLLVGVSVLVFVAAASLKDRVQVVQGGVGQGGGVAGGRSVGDPLSDSISISALPDGDELVANATAGYYFSMPANWYVEKSAGAGLALYPDYDPKSGATPECKIELSALAAASSSLGGGDSRAANLDAWVTNYLHADPTADVAEMSRTPFRVGSSLAIEWQGTLNGVTTTLVYAAMPSANANENGSGHILELAPSTLSSPKNDADDVDNDDCGLALQALTANITFGNYAP